MQLKYIIKKVTQYGPSDVYTSYVSHTGNDSYADHATGSHKFNGHQDAVDHITGVINNHPDSVFEVKTVYVQ
jgi:hypothetical protein